MMYGTSIKSRPCRSRHRGAVLIGVLTAIAVVSVISFASVQYALRVRNSVRFEKRVLQSQFLCEAGIRRAEYQLQKDPSYSGEEWLPDVPHLKMDFASVKIEVSNASASDASQSNKRSVLVIARLGDPADARNSVQQSYPVLVTVNEN